MEEFTLLDWALIAVTVLNVGIALYVYKTRIMLETHSKIRKRLLKEIEEVSKARRRSNG